MGQLQINYEKCPVIQKVTNEWNKDSDKGKERGETRGQRLIRECTNGGNPVYLHWTLMFSNDTISHHLILTKTSGDWNIDPCGAGKHLLGWLQCVSVDSILHTWLFFFSSLKVRSLSLMWRRSVVAFALSSEALLSMPAISTLSPAIDDMSRLKLPSICNSQEENNINTNINFQLNCPIIPFCLPVDQTATQCSDRTITSLHPVVCVFISRFCSSISQTVWLLTNKCRADKWN